MRYKEDGNPEKNRGACWNKIGKKEDFMLMKITVEKPGNHTFVLFKNKKKGNDPDSFYDKNPAWFVFDYENKDKNKNDITYPEDDNNDYNS